jgi:Ankyrin repeats (3 copies)
MPFVIEKKRKADSLSRVAAAIVASSGANNAVETNGVSSGGTNANCSGRGRLSGWTTCPLCAGFSTKRYALGRGIASHLHAVHTPWNPGKIEKKKRRRLTEQRQPNIHQDSDRQRGTAGAEILLESTPPNQEAIDEWDTKVLKLVAELEEKARQSAIARSDFTALHAPFIQPGLDRNGQDTQDYRESLPPFLQAAANGDLTELRAMVRQRIERVTEDNTSNLALSASSDESVTFATSGCILELLDTRDRHLSCAEHWAAGGGHIECLQYLLKLRCDCRLALKEDVLLENGSKRSKRRRDGKTCLHYAARNGHLNCVKFLIEQLHHAVDDASGDGTTPFHMACFGGHFETAKCLIENGANALATNDWGCGAAHWIGMTRSKSESDVRLLCRLLQSHGVCFTTPQKQGHTPLHKAAQKLNDHVIEFMALPVAEGGAGLSDEQKRLAGLPDQGGHTASEIWVSMGGDDKFGQRMKEEWGW